MAGQGHTYRPPARVSTDLQPASPPFMPLLTTPVWGTVGSGRFLLPQSAPLRLVPEPTNSARQHCVTEGAWATGARVPMLTPTNRGTLDEPPDLCDLCHLIWKLDGLN